MPTVSMDFRYRDSDDMWCETDKGTKSMAPIAQLNWIGIGVKSNESERNSENSAMGIGWIDCNGLASKFIAFDTHITCANESKKTDIKHIHTH